MRGEHARTFCYGVQVLRQAVHLVPVVLRVCVIHSFLVPCSDEHEPPDCQVAGSDALSLNSTFACILTNQTGLFTAKRKRVTLDLTRRKTARTLRRAAVPRPRPYRSFEKEESLASGLSCRGTAFPCWRPTTEDMKSSAIGSFIAPSQNNVGCPSPPASGWARGAVSRFRQPPGLFRADLQHPPFGGDWE